MATPSSILMIKAQTALSCTQAELGDVLGASKRTVQRWQHGGAILLPQQWGKLATAVHPHDRDLAASIAAEGGTNLVDLGLERPPSPPRVVEAEPPPPPLPTSRLVEAVVGAAADAMSMIPRAARPGVAAAFVCAAELRLSVAEVVAALTGEPRRKAKRGSDAV